MPLILAFLFFHGCAATRLGTAAVEGTADGIIRTSPSVKSIEQRVTNLESVTHDNMATMKIMINSLNHVAKMIDVRLQRMEDGIMRIRNKKGRVKGIKEPKSLFEL